MKNAKISIIVPVYNVEKYLDRCVDSVVSQTHKNIEIILVDDGSPDSCPKMCDDWAEKDNRIKVIHKTNGGLSSARNAGIKIMTGEYVCFVDSDDWISPNYVERLLDAISVNNADMSACKFHVTSDVNDSFVSKKENIQLISKEKFYCALTEESYAGYACNKLYKSDIILSNAIFFDEKIFNGEDLPFTVEYLTHCEKVTYIPEENYFYYIRPGSITTNVKLSEKFVTILYAREKVMRIIGDYSPENLDIVRAGYLSHLIKIKYMLYSKRKGQKDFYKEINNKIRANSKGTMFFKKVPLKSKLKLLAMLRFSIIFGIIYRKRKVS